MMTHTSFLCSKATLRGNQADLDSLWTERQGEDKSSAMIACFIDSPASAERAYVHAELGTIDDSGWRAVLLRGKPVRAQTSVELAGDVVPAFIPLPACAIPTGWYAWRVSVMGVRSYEVFRALDPGSDSIGTSVDGDLWSFEPDVEPCVNASLLLCERVSQHRKRPSLFGCHISRKPVVSRIKTTQWALGGIVSVPRFGFDPTDPLQLDIQLRLTQAGAEIRRVTRTLTVRPPIAAAPDPWQESYVPIRLPLPALRPADDEGEYAWEVDANGDIVGFIPFILQGSRESQSE